MIDLETTAALADACIMSIGACKFDLGGLGITDKFYLNVDAKSCKKLGMRVDLETLKWWAKQPKPVRDALQLPTPIDIHEALTEFAKWYDADYIWCRGMFDVPILDLAFHLTGIKSPYKYWDAIDHRTICTLLGEDFTRISKSSDDYHNALGDAVRQATHVIKLFEKEPF